MKLKLYQNELGLLRTEDGKYGIRQNNEESWILQHRNNPLDPWDWEIIGHFRTQTLAIDKLGQLLKREEKRG